MKKQDIEPNGEAPRETTGVTWQFKFLAGVLIIAFLAMAARILGLL